MKFLEKPLFKIGDKVKTTNGWKLDDVFKFESENPGQAGMYEKGATFIIEGYIVTGDAWNHLYWGRDSLNRLAPLHEKDLKND